jgi:DNA-binding LacI/PurR family transcriptional regulator
LAYIRWQEPGKTKGVIAFYTHCAKRAAELGYRLEKFDLGEWERPQRIWKILYARGFAGILLDGVYTDRLPFFLQNEYFPMVCCGRFDPLPFHTVRPDVFRPIRQLWFKLIDRGYRRIGAAICRHCPPLEDDFSRHGAVLCCQKEIDTGCTIPPFLGSLYDLKSFISWVKAYEPDVVIGFHNGHYFALLDAGYSIPRDLGFACLHAAGHETIIAGMDQNFEMICRTAVDFLHQLIRHGEKGTPEYPLNTVIDSTWVEGRSVLLRHI